MTYLSKSRLALTRLPDQIDAPMTPRQLATLRTLSAVAYQPKQFQRDLTATEAERRISALKAEIELAEFVLGRQLRKRGLVAATRRRISDRHIARAEPSEER